MCREVILHAASQLLPVGQIDTQEVSSLSGFVNVTCQEQNVGTGLENPDTSNNLAGFLGIFLMAISTNISQFFRTLLKTVKKHKDRLKTVKLHSWEWLYPVWKEAA